MKISFEVSGVNYTVQTEKFFDISIGIKKQNNVNCYHLDEPSFSYFENEYFVGSLKKGGSVNCEKVSFYAHASGTHTECALHVLDANFTMLDLQVPILQLGKVITIQPKKNGEDQLIDEEVLAQLTNTEQATALVVRTLPNQNFKKHFKYAGTNPPFFTVNGIRKIKDLGFKHLLTDLPSIDKEQDGGLLAAHKQWFTTNHAPDIERTITEFIYTDNAIVDGLFGVAMRIPKIETDAVPSSVLIYPCQ
ncbi:MAG: cyclase family protein [bacterium]|nr:cyclase family protein [bacterium]